MAIGKDRAAILDLIKKAASNDELALVECTNKQTGKVVFAVCAVSLEGEEYLISPLAKLFDGDPQEELNPPTAD